MAPLSNRRITTAHQFWRWRVVSPRLPVTLNEPQDDYLAGLADDEGPHDSKAGAVRGIIDDHRTDTSVDVDAMHEEYEEQIDELGGEIKRLNRERRQLLEQREENQELVRFADEQRSVVRAQREEERRRRQTNIVRRTWWKVAGEPDFDVATQD